MVLPAPAEVVLAIEDASGLRAFLEAAGRHASSLAPEPSGAALRDRVGVDLLSRTPGFGLAARGTRLLVFSQRAVGLAAPLRDAKAARKALASWLSQDRRRAGRVFRGRVLTASGPGARSLLAALSRPVPLPFELRGSASGPLWLWARLAEPLRGVVLSIEAGSSGLVAHGLVTASAPILAGPAPAGCEGGIACLRAGVAEAGRLVIARALEAIGAAAQPELRGASRVEERLEDIDVGQLGDDRSLSRALRITAVFGGAEAPGPALEGRVELDRVDAALAQITPLFALRGTTAASAYALHLLYGGLLRNAGPLTATALPRGGNAAQLDLRLPLR